MDEQERRKHCVHDWRLEIIDDLRGAQIDVLWYCTRCRSTEIRPI